jgi:hypothetical protein
MKKLFKNLCLSIAYLPLLGVWQFAFASYADGGMSNCLFNTIEEQYAEIFPPASAQTLSSQSDSGDYIYYRSYSSDYQSGLAVFQDSFYYALYGEWYYFSDFNYANQLFANNTCVRQSSSVVTKPNAPSSMSASAVSSNSIKISWTDSSNNETGFNLYRYVGNAWTKIATLSANVTSYTDTGLQSATTYYYAVESYNSAGASWTTVSDSFVSATTVTNSTTNTNTGGSTSSQGYNVVPIRLSGNLGYYTGTRANDLYKDINVDFQNALYVVEGGNDVIEFSTAIKATQYIYIYGADIISTPQGKNPSNVSVRRSGNDLYIQYNSSAGSGSLTIKNYFVGANANRIFLYDDPSLGYCPRWIPIL